MMYLPVLLLWLACGSGSGTISGTSDPGPNRVKFKITPGTGQHMDVAPFKAAEYSLDFSEAVVNDGSYSGLEIIFAGKTEEKVKWILGFELPAAKTMKVYYQEKGVRAEMPQVPFTVTEADFQGLKNALYEKEQMTYIYLKREITDQSGNVSTDSFYFGVFELKVTAADFGPDSFSMDCTFRAQGDSDYTTAVGMDYSVEGSFSISGQEYHLAQVD